MSKMVKKNVKLVEFNAYKVNKDTCSVDFVCMCEISGSERAARKIFKAQGYDFDFVKVGNERVVCYAMPLEQFMQLASVVEPDVAESVEE